MSRRYAFSLSFAILVFSCNAFGQSAASIKYGLADTRLAFSLELVLIECTADTLTTKATLTMVPEAVRSAETEVLEGEALKAKLRKRDVTVALYENGTIKSIGSTTENRTAAVIGSILRLATTLATGFAPAPAPAGALVEEDQPEPGYFGDGPPCKPEVLTALRNVNSYVSRIAELKEGMASQGPEEIVRTQTAVDGLAKAVAELRTGPLRIELRNSIVPGAELGAELCRGVGFPVMGPYLEWKPAPFLDWIDNPQNAQRAACNYKLAIRYMEEGDLGQHGEKPRRGRPYIMVREPFPTELEVHPVQPSTWQQDDLLAPLISAPVLVGQWGTTTYLPLEARFGQSRTVKLEFDQFGRKTSFTWGSNAGIEGVTAGLLEAATAAGAYSTATADQTALQEQQAKILELETRQKLNALLHCEEVILAGGFTCPEN